MNAREESRLSRELCFSPATSNNNEIRSGTFFFSYNQTRNQRKVTHFRITTGQLPVVEQTITLSKGGFNTSVLEVELTYVNATVLYAFARFFDKRIDHHSLAFGNNV